MWFIRALVSAFCLAVVTGFNCSNQCCYYYHGVPANVTSMQCNPDGNIVNWECQVYSPHDPGSNLSVKWYRSVSVVSVREEGELITERKGGRYTFSVTRATSPVNDSQMIVNGLFLDLFQLTIHNYNSSIDGGYYWCQMVINDTICLQPSDIGRIPPSSDPTRSCSFNSFAFVDFEMPRVCAIRSSCTREVMITDSATSTPSQGQTASSSLGTTFTASNADIESESGAMAVALYAVIGVLVFVIAILLIIIVGFVVHTLRNHSLRVYEVKQQRDHELRAVKDPSPRPVSEVHNQFTQTGDDDTALEVAHRSEWTDTLPSARPVKEGVPPPDSSPPLPPASTHHPVHPGVPPPDSSPPLPPTTPDPTDTTDTTDTTKPSELMNENAKQLSRLSSNNGYAHPQPLSKSRGGAKSSPALVGNTKYQDIRLSRLNYEHMYSVATNSKRNPNYVNVPNSKS